MDHNIAHQNGPNNWAETNTTNNNDNNSNNNNNDEEDDDDVVVSSNDNNNLIHNNNNDNNNNVDNQNHIHHISYINNNNNRFTPYEQECIDFIESSLSTDVESECENEKLNYERKLWAHFQNSAMAITQLYTRDNLTSAHNVWNTFQQASTNVTCLFKESAEYHKRNYEVFHHIGYHKRTREILNWIKKKKNLIRREELLAYLSGHHNNPNSYFSHRLARNSRFNRNFNNNNNNNINDPIQQYSSFNPQNISRNNPRFILSDASKTEPDDLTSVDEINTSLETFKESLSNIRNSAVLFSSTNSNKRNSWNDEDLNEFIEQQHYRHVESRKRNSSMDICMDSPNSKRTKFC